MRPIPNFSVWNEGTYRRHLRSIGASALKWRVNMGVSYAPAMYL